MFLLDLDLILIERVKHFIYILMYIIRDDYLTSKVPSCGVNYSCSAYFLRRFMCYLAYWMFVNRSLPFIANEQ